MMDAGARHWFASVGPRGTHANADTRLETSILQVRVNQEQSL
jgi:hypothetical protein